jgi:hypothetical protein
MVSLPPPPLPVLLAKLRLCMSLFQFSPHSAFQIKLPTN